ncbi:MAG: tRNA (guanosine(37)-N1)-methyltransferase TrmD [Anaerolineales bacterium]|jgi:tRNA (guanine37-N1)-methyltransferase
MRIDVFTLLPEVFPVYLDSSILLRARTRGLLQVEVHNIREFTHDKHRTTDDIPYGGGGGMVMKPEPVYEAVESVLGIQEAASPPCPIVLLTPQGRLFKQSDARELSMEERIGLICGRYEGFDERIRALATHEVSIGDFVLTGGELPALMLIDAVARLLPGALGDPGGAEDDSHADGLLEYPHYTRPAQFRGQSVPEVLLSGDHAQIARWRRRQALLRTFQRRPDLLSQASLSAEDTAYVRELGFHAQR